MHIPLRFLGFVLCLLFLLAAAPAHALPKCDVAAGFSRLGSDAFYPNVGGLSGWQGAMHCKAKPFVGIEGDVSQYGLGANASIPRTTAVLGGVRLTVPLAIARVYVHALGGAEHSSNSAGVGISGGAFAYALGAGVDLPLAAMFSWRVSADYIQAPSLSPATGTHARFGAGIVFRF